MSIEISNTYSNKVDHYLELAKHANIHSSIYITEDQEKRLNLLPKKINTLFQKKIESFSINGKEVDQKDFENELEILRNALKIKRCNIKEKKLERYQFFYIPEEQALAYKCAHYKEKYDINLVVSIAQSIDTILSKNPCNTAKSFGLIFENSKNGHTTPILFDQTASGKWNLFVMNSVITFTAPLENLILSAQRHIDIETIFILRSSQQYDQASCRTGALITLRNLLLYLRHHELDLKECLFEHYGEKEISNKICALYGENPFLMSAWGHTSQIWREGSEKEEMLPVIRDYFSKKETPVKKIKEFKARFVQNINVQEIFSLDLGPFFNRSSYEVALNPRASKRNLYLLYKGAQIAMQITQDPNRYEEETLSAHIIIPELET